MQKKSNFTNFYYHLTIVVSIVLITIVFTERDLLQIGPLQKLELKFLDKKFQERGEIKLEEPTNVIIVEISDDTYSQIPYSYPWPRDIFAKAVENLFDAGVKAVGIDIIFTDQHKAYPNKDKIFEQTLSKYDDVVLAGKVDLDREAKINRLFMDEDISPGAISTPLNNNFGNYFKKDNTIGIVNVVKDSDNIYRRYRPFWIISNLKSINEREFIKKPSFATSVVKKYYDFNSEIEYNSDYFLLDSIKIPRYDASSFLVNFYSSNLKRTFKHFHLTDIVDDSEFKTSDELSLDVDINTWDNKEYGLKYSELFKDKIVLIGSTSPEDGDLVSVAFSEGHTEGDNEIYGIQYHATVIQNILNRQFIQDESLLVKILLVVVISILFYLVISFLKRIKLKYRFILEILGVFLLLMGIYLVYKLSNWSFAAYNLHIEVIPLFSSIFLAYLGSTIFFYIDEYKQNVMIKNMFSHYVSSTLVDELTDNPDKLKLGGEKKELTVLFTDIKAFTRISENLPPEKLVNLMNDYLNSMTKIILRNSGTLDKYIGDAIMAFWGAPAFIKEHYKNACYSALEMQRTLKELNIKNIKQGYPKLEIRTGINTGEVIVGNIGGEKRFDYTAIGDAVNLASRLEGVNKVYGTSIIISENTYQLVKDYFYTRELDFIRVKGKNLPVKIYELVGEKDNPLIKKEIIHLENYFKGLDEYKKRNFKEAIYYFNDQLRENSDKPTKIYLDRSIIYVDNPPEADWDGVFIMKTK